MFVHDCTYFVGVMMTTGTTAAGTTAAGTTASTTSTTASTTSVTQPSNSSMVDMVDDETGNKTVYWYI